MSNLTHDDPRLTAYALGELPASERALMESELINSPELRAEVELIRALSGNLSAELSKELGSTPTLTRPQRAAIVRAATPRAWRVIGWSVITAAAASIALMVMMPERALMAPPSQSFAMKPLSEADSGPTGASFDASGSTIAPSAPSAPSAATLPTVVPSAPLLARVDKDAARFSLQDPTKKPGQEFSRKAEKEYAEETNAPTAREEKIITNKKAIPPPVTVAAATQTKNSPIVGNTVGEDMKLTMRAQDKPAATDSVAVEIGEESGSTGAFTSIGASDEARRDDAARAEKSVTSTPSSVAVNGAFSSSAKAKDSNNEKTHIAPVARSPDFRFQPTSEEAPAVPPATVGGEAYNQRLDHIFRASRSEPLSTFGLDVDTASYGNVRRMIDAGRLPPRDAVRVEEFVNYFPYNIPVPQDGEAFGVTVEVAPCPWEPAHRLARIAVRGKAVTEATRQPLNLVFLVDVSGSMQPDNRLPLIKTGLTLLANNLTKDDKVSIVTYAGSAGVVLPATSGADVRTILKAVDRLSANGSTNGGSGIQLAYDAAQAGFVRGGVNRVILCTDGDFNVGVTNRDELVRMVQTRAKNGIFLTVLGVGEDNLKDATMELLADKANGNYHYIDTSAEARKVLVEQMSATLVTIAKDVKAQVEFNPARVGAWRQLGYEKRQLAARDFNDDRKDAGEIGAGHVVTMLYELVPATALVGEEALRYQTEPPAAVAPTVHGDELLTVKLRYKAPDSNTSRLVQGVVTDNQVRGTPSEDQRFASAVAAFAMRLRGTEAMALDWRSIRDLAHEAVGQDPQGYRREFVQMVERVGALNYSRPKMRDDK